MTWVQALLRNAGWILSGFHLVSSLSEIWVMAVEKLWVPQLELRTDRFGQLGSVGRDTDTAGLGKRPCAPTPSFPFLPEFQSRLALPPLWAQISLLHNLAQRLA